MLRTTRKEKNRKVCFHQHVAAKIINSPNVQQYRRPAFKCRREFLFSLSCKLLRKLHPDECGSVKDSKFSKLHTWFLLSSLPQCSKRKRNKTGACISSIVKKMDTGRPKISVRRKSTHIRVHFVLNHTIKRYTEPSLKALFFGCTLHLLWVNLQTNLRFYPYIMGILDSKINNFTVISRIIEVSAKVN